MADPTSTIPPQAPEGGAAGSARAAQSTAGASTLEGSAIRHPGAHVVLWLVAVVGLATDLISKEWAFHTLRQGGDEVVIPHLLEWHTTFNPGALFGIGQGQTELFLVASGLALLLVLWMFWQSGPRQWLVHIALGAIVAGALGNFYDRVFVRLVPQVVLTANGPMPLYFEVRAEPENGVLVLTEYPATAESLVRHVSLERQDELPRPVGYVRDFIKIPTRWFGGRELWPWVFNVADMLLVGGVSVLALRMLLERKEQPVVRAGAPGVLLSRDPEPGDHAGPERESS